jgi:hypothetical protein
LETIAKEEKEHVVEKQIDVILPLEGEFTSPKAEETLNADEYIGVEEVVGGGEVLKIGEDELNRVISTLKDELNRLARLCYSSYHLEGKVIFEGVECVMAWLAEGGRNGVVLCPS